MSVGINGYQLIILVVLALVILGPERLPDYAKKLAHWVRQLRVLAQDARVRFKEETGTDFDDVDWRQYDPRRYDPRRIIREALAEDYEQTRRAIGSVRDSASITPKSGSSTAGSGSASGSAKGAASSTGAVDAAAGPSVDAAETPGGTPGEPPRPHDPRALFGGSASTGIASGAVAAGLAGAASLGVTGRSAPAASAPEQEPALPAPFDVDAT